MTTAGTDGHNPGSRVALRSDDESSNGPPTLRGEEESFFRAGDEGRYEGGPATAIDQGFELDMPARPRIIRTPEMDARRARFVRFVAASLGALTALFAIGLVRRTAVADSSSHHESAGMFVAAPTPPAAHAPVSDLHPAAQQPAAAEPGVAKAPDAVKSPEAAKPTTGAIRVAHAVNPKPPEPIRTAIVAPTVAKAVANFAASVPKSTPAPAPAPAPGKSTATAAFPIAH